MVSFCGDPQGIPSLRAPPLASLSVDLAYTADAQVAAHFVEVSRIEWPPVGLQLNSIKYRGLDVLRCGCRNTLSLKKP